MPVEHVASLKCSKVLSSVVSLTGLLWRLAQADVLLGLGGIGIFFALGQSGTNPHFPPGMPYERLVTCLFVGTSVTRSLLPVAFFYCYAQLMTELLEEVLRKVATLPREEQDAIASQIIETLQDEAAWKEKLARAPEKLRRLAKEAQREHEYGETHPLDELL